MSVATTPRLVGASQSDLAQVRPADVKTVASALEVLHGRRKKGPLARVLPFLGPAFIAAIAYVDPGNFATNIQSGARYGYRLLWVIFASNLMALLVQSLSAKLGIATGKNLAELCRDSLRQPVVYGMWFLMEAVAMATDLAEFVGAALGLSLLFHIPLLWGAVSAVVITFAALELEHHGFRPLEVVIGLLLAVVAGSYVIETFLDRPDWLALARHALIPGFSGVESVLLAAGILGATVMPHAVFLHSGLTQSRIPAREPRLMKRLYRFELLDCAIAMGTAGFVNAAMLVMSAATFHRNGLVEIATIEEAHRTLAPLLGQASSWVFAVSLVASGLSSTMVGTMSGQLIMQGFLRKKIPLWLRRTVTLAPSFLVVLLGLDPTRSLVLSQVVLSFALPFALVPLVWFTSRKDIMGPLVNRRVTSVAAATVTALIVALNAYLLYEMVLGV
ncbi:MAG TPA: Nramp family divalent metal transporter [Firmicutes bacterium]|nr:Nramp family divalent metal transporter [Bacillota bacterium]